MTAVKPPVAGTTGALSAVAGEVVTRTLLFSVLWWLLAGGNWESWVIGIFAVPLTVWCSLSLFSAAESPGPQDGTNAIRFQTLELPKFALFFLWQSLSGGWESARFALGPRVAVRPGFLRFTMQLPEGRPRLYFVQLVNMLPGTVSVALDGDELLVHALDRESDNNNVLASCEERIAALFNCPIAHSAGHHVKRQ
jgi:multicomponent Na+:H+ antiporter subunit E